MREHEPADDATNDVTSRQRDVEVKCLKFGKAGGFEEDNGVAQDSVTTEDLCRPNNAVLRVRRQLYVAKHGGRDVLTISVRRRFVP